MVVSLITWGFNSGIELHLAGSIGPMVAGDPGLNMAAGTCPGCLFYKVWSELS